jgi:hypothetical protein
MAMEAWKAIDLTYSFQDRWLTVRSDRGLLPNGQVLSPYHTIEGPDAANIVALRLRKILLRELVEKMQDGTLRFREADQLATLFLAHIFASRGGDPRLKNLRF